MSIENPMSKDQATSYKLGIEEQLNRAAFNINHAQMTTNDRLLKQRYRMVKTDIGLLKKLCYNVLMKYRTGENKTSVEKLIRDTDNFLLYYHPVTATGYRDCINKADKIYMEYNQFMIDFCIVKV